MASRRSAALARRATSVGGVPSAAGRVASIRPRTRSAERLAAWVASLGEAQHLGDLRVAVARNEPFQPGSREPGVVLRNHQVGVLAGAIEHRQDGTTLDEVAFTGRVVYIGYAKEPVTYETKLFVQKEIDILGARNALPENFRDVIQMLEQRRFPVELAVSKIASLREAPEVLRAWNSNPGQFTKIMITFD